MAERSMDDDDRPGFRFGRFGSGVGPGRSGGGTMPGRSGGMAPGRNIGTPKSASGPVSATTREAVLNRLLPPKIPDAEFTPDPMSSFQVGDRVEHNRFGVGKVLEITGQVPEIKAKIAFEKFGEKLLLLKYAKIRHI